MNFNTIIKTISFLVVILIVLSFSGCKKISEGYSSVFSSDVATTTSDNTISDESSASNIENSETASEVLSTASETNNSVSSSTSTKAESASQSTSPTCSHERFWGDGILIINDWHDRLPGVENRYTLTPNTCTENRQIVYKCPICSEPVLYEEIEPIGHNFSDEEELLTYPSGRSDGSYGYRCQNWNCDETQISRTIPKLTGDYSGIDSCFSISRGTENEDVYIIEHYITIFDERTGGSIPTIRYDVNTLRGEIEFINADGELVKHTIYLEQDKLDDGWHYRGYIRDNSYYVDYWKMA